MKLDETIKKENDKREEALQRRCKREQLTRLTVLHIYGDPKNWNVVKRIW